VLSVRSGGKDAGTATPHHITRHSHPKARPEDPGSGDDAPRATGIDYLALLGDRHDRQSGDRVNYSALAGPDAAGGEGSGTQGRPGQDEEDRGGR
jgi:putative transposase